MKKLFAIITLLCAFSAARAENLQFSYTADADIVSSYVWRGLYYGGLSFQPEVGIGWTSEHTSFNVITWWNVGATDWGFRSGLEQDENWNPNTYLTKEADILVGLNLWGATMGLSHYYYLDGTNYFNFGDINEIEGTAQTEVYLGYDFSTLFPKVDFNLTWYTFVSGSDIAVNGKRAYSSYIEANYTQHFKYDFALKGTLGVSPWRSMYTDGGDEDIAKDFAVNNISLRLDKSWSFANDAVGLTVFIQGMMNTCNLNKDNAFIKASGDDKLGQQKLMGLIGVNFSF